MSEAHTHVRKHYLELIEAGAFGELPSPVQARGMLANYAEFLNLDVDAILLYYARRTAKAAARISNSSTQARSRPFPQPECAQAQELLFTGPVRDRGHFSWSLPHSSSGGVNRIMSVNIAESGSYRPPLKWRMSCWQTSAPETPTPDPAQD